MKQKRSPGHGENGRDECARFECSVHQALPRASVGWAFGAGLCRAARFAPLAVVLVPPEHFLQDGIDDVVGVALDEPGVVFEEFD